MKLARKRRKILEIKYEIYHKSMRSIYDAKNFIKEMYSFIPDFDKSPKAVNKEGREIEVHNMYALKYNLYGSVERSIFGRNNVFMAFKNTVDVYEMCMDALERAVKIFKVLNDESPNGLWLVPQDFLSDEEKKHRKALKILDIATAIIERDMYLKIRENKNE